MGKPGRKGDKLYGPAGGGWLVTDEWGDPKSKDAVDHNGRSWREDVKGRLVAS